MMTERKPAGMSFTNWIDQQITEAAERGAFDNLPGAGKPLPQRPAEDAGQAWLRDYLRREGVPTQDVLPTPLKLRKELELLPATVSDLRTEQQVREAVGELNSRIMQWRRVPVGPPIFVPLADEEAVVAGWRDRQPPTTAPSSAGPVRQEAVGPVRQEAPASPEQPQASARRAMRRGWHRFGRRGQR